MKKSKCWYQWTSDFRSTQHRHLCIKNNKHWFKHKCKCGEKS